MPRRTAIALAAAIAVAPCFFQVGAANAAGLFEVQVTPAGSFGPRDGRKMDVPAWKIDASVAARVIEAFRANQTPLVLDYEHQTLFAEDNGQPAPAAGWFRDLQWRDGVGLVAVVELTRRAQDYVASDEYRYFSPVFEFDARTGEVKRLLMGALTNNPAIDGMAQVAQRAAARFDLSPKETSMNPHLLAVCVALGLSLTDDQDDAAAETAALAAIKAKDTDHATAIAAAKAQAAPDPAKFVGVEVVEELKKQVAALSADHTARAVDDLVKPALADGRLLPAQEKWARDLGAKDVASLTAYLKDAQPIAALAGSQTGGRRPVADNEHGLTADEVAVCTATGTSHKDFAAAKSQSV